MKKKDLFIISMIIILFILCCFYLHYENTSLKVSNYDILNDKIPEKFDEYKIVQISDFHNTRSKTLRNSLIEEIKEFEPNIIVITGDFIDVNRTDTRISLDFIKEINSIAPIYYVPGNHEAEMTNYQDFKNELSENKVIILDNKLEKLLVETEEINLIGVNDPRMANAPSVSDAAIVDKELKSIEYDNNKFTILLSHRPELIDTYEENNIDLVLSGHAHGGQIRVPFIGGLFAPNQGIFPKLTSGTHEQGKTTLLVSRGIGNSTFPFRINNRPELVSITLNNEKQNKKNNYSKQLGTTTIKLNIPNGWKYEEITPKKSDNFKYALKLYKSSPDKNMTLYYYKSPFVVCGTGRTSKTIKLNNEEEATIGYYENNEKWSDIAFFDLNPNVAFINNDFEEDTNKVFEFIKTIDITIEKNDKN